MIHRLLYLLHHPAITLAWGATIVAWNITTLFWMTLFSIALVWGCAVRYNVAVPENESLVVMNRWSGRMRELQQGTHIMVPGLSKRCHVRIMWGDIDTRPFMTEAYWRAHDGCAPPKPISTHEFLPRFEFYVASEDQATTVMREDKNVFAEYVMSYKFLVQIANPVLLVQCVGEGEMGQVCTDLFLTHFNPAHTLFPVPQIEFAEPYGVVQFPIASWSSRTEEQNQDDPVCMSYYTALRDVYEKMGVLVRTVTISYYRQPDKDMRFRPTTPTPTPTFQAGALREPATLEQNEVRDEAWVKQYLLKLGDEMKLTDFLTSVVDATPGLRTVMSALVNSTDPVPVQEEEVVHTAPPTDENQKAREASVESEPPKKPRGRGQSASGSHSSQSSPRRSGRVRKPVLRPDFVSTSPAASPSQSSPVRRPVQSASPPQPPASPHHASAPAPVEQPPETEPVPPPPSQGQGQGQVPVPHSGGPEAAVSTSHSPTASPAHKTGARRKRNRSKSARKKAKRAWEEKHAQNAIPVT